MKTITRIRCAISVVLTITGLLLVHSAIRSQSLTARPLGVFTLGHYNTTGCPGGFLCYDFTVSCPNVAQTIPGSIAVKLPTVAPTGVVVFFSGAGGGEWWQSTSALVPPFFQSLLNRGLILIQVQWGNSGWLATIPNGGTGQELLACRPATAIKWIHDVVYSPLRLNPPIGHCGFCLTGNSGGSAQIAYALSSYGLDGMVNAMIPTSGPPLAAIASTNSRSARPAAERAAAPLPAGSGPQARRCHKTAQ